MPLTCQAIKEIYGKYFRYFDFSFSFQHHLTEKFKKKDFKDFVSEIPKILLNISYSILHQHELTKKQNFIFYSPSTPVDKEPKKMTPTKFPLLEVSILSYFIKSNSSAR
ncbi:hypothetical protein C4N15_04930 [Fusobacterium necrophorum subsp. funduliforme]|nr:hypothetical protein C4N15_04930 [Fusobacterium necrophorum subsp. funduliforme]